MDGFEQFVSGAGDDRLIGNDGVGETFDPGLGYNQVDAGDSAGVVDYVDYSASSTVSGVNSEDTSAGTKTKTFSFTNSSSQPVNAISVTLGTTTYSATNSTGATDLASLVGIIAGQMTTDGVVAGVSGNGTATASSNSLVITTLNSDTDAQAVMTNATAEEYLYSEVNVDLSSKVSLDVNVAYSSEAYLAQKNGSTDELSGIEGVLGTAFNDVINGGAEDNIILAGSGNDTIDGGAGSRPIRG